MSKSTRFFFTATILFFISTISLFAQDRAEFINNWLVNEGISGTRIHLEINKKSSNVPRVEIKKMN